MDSILLVVNMVPNKLGSYEKFMMRFGEQCRERGVTVHYYLAGEPIDVVKESFDRSGSVVHVEPDWSKGPSAARHFRFIRNYLGLVRKYKFSVVAFNFCDEVSVIASLVLSLLMFPIRRPKRSFWHQHSHQADPIGYVQSHLSKLKVASLLLTGVCPLCEHASEVMRRRTIDARKIFVLYNGVDIGPTSDADRQALRHSLDMDRDVIAIVSAGSLITRKNFAMMIKGFAKAMQIPGAPKMRFLAVGVGDQEDALRDLVKALQIEPHVMFLGYRNDVPAVTNASDICLLTSYTEGFSFFFSESFGLAKPIICTPVGVVPEILIDGVNGNLVDFDDIDGLSSAILRLAKNPAIREAYGEEALKVYRERFTLGAMMDNYMKLYFDESPETSRPVAETLTAHG